MSKEVNKIIDENWWKKFLNEDIDDNDSGFLEEEKLLFQKYELDKNQKRIYKMIQECKNMPKPEVSPEEIIFGINVKKFGIRGDMKYYRNSVENYVRNLPKAAKKFGYGVLKPTKIMMKLQLESWFNGSLVIDPKLKTSEGNPIQYVREGFGKPVQEQSDLYKKNALDFFIVMCERIFKAYPEATVKGIVSLSDFQNFNLKTYDMDSKRRNADITSLIPLKLVRMISFNPDEEMKKQFESMKRVMKKYGAVVYDDLETVLKNEPTLPKDLPTFMGGEFKVDILECLKVLYTDKEERKLLLDTYKEMKESGELPNPKHMQ